MKTIAVIFGSRSAEHDISIITAISSVIKPLEALKKYKVEAVYISKNGEWYWDEKLKDIKLYQTGEIDEFLRKAPKVQLQIGDGLVLVKSSQFAGRKTYRKVDLAFPATHGTHGEDGELMGVLEMANVPYVGCDVTASAIAMDKVLSRQIAQYNEIPIPKYEYLMDDTFAFKGKEIIKELEKSLKYPLFVKPARLGSSIGISKVQNSRELTNAIEVALHYDSKAIIEEAIPNLVEVTVPIMGNKDLKYGSVEQPLGKEDGVFDFDKKYMNQRKGGKKVAGEKTGSQGYSKIPADISENLKKEALRVAGAAYRSIGCEGIARVDLLIDKKKQLVYFNEVNPMPGSLYRHNWQASGISAVELVQNLIDYAVERWQKKQKLSTVFNTNFLKQF